MKKLLFLAALLATVPALAQNTTFLSVATCGNQTYLANRPAPPTVDLTGANCIAGSISASTTAKATAAAPTYIEGTSNPLSMDLSGNLRVTGSLSLSGTTSNASSGVATSSTNLPTVAYTYGFNGTTWDQLQVDASKFLKVIAQTGSTTAATQATAANLNATVVGTGTFVTQATLAAETTKVIGTVNQGTSPWVVSGAVTGSGNFTVVQPTGTNLHAVLDTTSTTAVTQATATNLNAAVVGTGTAGSAAGGILTIQGVASMTKLLVTPDANSAVNVAQINGVTVLMGNGVTGTGSQRVTIASDNTAFSVNATLTAETTKVVGTVRNLGNVGAIFDGVNTAATAPANGVLGLGIYNSTEPSPTTGQSVGIQLDAKGRQRIALMDAAGNTRGANVDANNNLGVVLAAETTKVIGTVNQGTSPWIAAGGGTAGSAASGVVTVQGIASMTKLLVTPDANSAINLAQVGGNTVVTGGTNGSLAIGGTVATNVAITANPVNLGAQAVSSENTAATTARQVQLVADLVGKLIVLPYSNPENFVSGVTAAMTGTTSTSLIAAPASGLRNYVTHLICTNSHATVGTFVLVQDGNGGTTIYEGYAVAVGGGFSISFPAPLRQPTTATAIYVADVTTGANVICAGSGYKGA